MLIVENPSGDYIRYIDVLPYFSRLLILEDNLTTMRLTLQDIQHSLNEYTAHLLTDRKDQG